MLIERNKVYNVDCLEGLTHLEPESVDMFLIDPPYGATQNQWDLIIDPVQLWKLLMRAVKPHGIIVMFGKGLFTAQMIMSNSKYYRYSLIWEKTSPVDFLNANRKPLAIHEDIIVFSPDDTHNDIMVFYKRLPTYNPQKTTGHPRKVSTAEHKRNSSLSTTYGEYKRTGYDSTERYPTTILRFSIDKQHDYYHPTQKPIELCRYLIRTYTNPGDLVVDCCCGSGSSIVAAAIEGRDYIGMDNGVCNVPNSQYYGRPWTDVTSARLAQIDCHPSPLLVSQNPSEISLFDFITSNNE